MGVVSAADKPQVADKISAFGSNTGDPAQVVYDVPVLPRYFGRRTIVLNDVLEEKDWTSQAWDAGIDIRERLGLPASGAPIPMSFNVVEALWLLHEELQAEGASQQEIAGLESVIAAVAQEESTNLKMSGQDVVNLLSSASLDPLAQPLVASRSQAVTLPPSDVSIPRSDIGRVSVSADPNDPRSERWAPLGSRTQEPRIPSGRSLGSPMIRAFLVSLTRGELLLPRRNWSGTFRLVKVPIPDKHSDPTATVLSEAPYAYVIVPLKPALFLVESYELTLAPAGFGIGRPVRAMTFLPGEIQTIPWLYWRPSDDVVSTTIVDSFTPFAADAFCNDVFVHVADAVTRRHNDTYGFEISRKAGFNPNVEAMDGTAVTSFNLGRREFAAQLKRALREHVARATDYRAAFEDADRPVFDPARVHKASNVNLGRTMTAVYRQLNQRYHCEIRLNDIRVGFSNGRLRSWREVPLWKLEEFVGAFVVSGSVAEITNKILKAATKVLDNKGSERSIVEEVNEGIFRVEPRVEEGGVLLEEYDLTLPTGSVLGEVLMGQADSLDQYALSLQSEDIASRLNDNALQKIEVDALEGITDAKARAEAYAKAFRPDDTFKVDLRQTP